ncbi:hypothetical protein CRUP_034671 [Coryphaenoides rupestris]|nr:hypothetical protein CRUP_034671 [Coryphaenoides rupestris]
MKEACKAMLSLYPKQSYPLEVLCSHHLKTDVQSEEASDCFSRLLEMAPNSGLARVGLGTKALQEGKYQDAIRNLAQGLKQAGSAPGWFSLAEAQLKLHRYSDSALSCSQGLTLCASGDEEVKMRLLRMRLETLVRSGEALAADQALETLQQIPGAETETDLKAFKGRAYLNKGQTEEALQVSSELLASQPNISQGLALRGLAQAAQGHLQLAEQSFLQAAAQSPDSGENYFLLGKLYWDMGEESRRDRSKAHTHLLKAAKLDPHLGRVYRYLGHYYRRVVRDAGRARGLLQEGLRAGRHR